MHIAYYRTCEMKANCKCGRNTLLLSFAFSFHLPDTKITSGRLRPPALTRKKKRWFALGGGGFLCCVSLRNCYFLVWNGRRAKEKDGLSVVQLNKLWAFCLSLFMSSVTPNPNPTHSNHAIFPTPPHTLSLKKLK